MRVVVAKPALSRHNGQDYYTIWSKHRSVLAAAKEIVMHNWDCDCASLFVLVDDLVFEEPSEGWREWIYNEKKRNKLKGERR